MDKLLLLLASMPWLRDVGIGIGGIVAGGLIGRWLQKRSSKTIISANRQEHVETREHMTNMTTFIEQTVHEVVGADGSDGFASDSESDLRLRVMRGVTHFILTTLQPHHQERVLSALSKLGSMTVETNLDEAHRRMKEATVWAGKVVAEDFPRLSRPPQVNPVRMGDVVQWKDAKGIPYLFTPHKLAGLPQGMHEVFPDNPAIYIFAKLEHDDTWTVLHIGDTPHFNLTFQDHQVRHRMLSAGATHVHVFFTKLQDEHERQSIVRGLRTANLPDR